MTPHKQELILLALKELYHASYSVERREECEELIRRIEDDAELQGDLLLRMPSQGER